MTVSSSAEFFFNFFFACSTGGVSLLQSPHRPVRDFVALS
jgi:hypothetical protein